MSENTATADEKLDRIQEALTEQRTIVESIAGNLRILSAAMEIIAGALSAVLEENAERRGLRKVPRQE